MDSIVNPRKAKKKIIIESFILSIIALTPFLFKAYDYFPGPNSRGAHDTISFLGITIGSNGFDSISTNIWFYSSKLIPLTLLILWFFTSKNWWYHIIIIPIATYAFQLFELIFSEDNVIDSENIWWVIPVCMVVIPIVYFIRIKLYDRYVHGIDIEAMERELNILKQKQKKATKDSTSTDTIEVDKNKKVYEVEDKFKVYSLSEELNRKLSTHNIEKQFKHMQDTLLNWFHLKF
ncbi:hypothetical protein [uncultured Maribacter sp.]|uniref:hypothetical protein n=1 Tax=uncultured Maribacter sp. TaxID=431308 RepID=UPI00260982AD|nr:hypothetical protein [uncultured Maribacter sp.]